MEERRIERVKKQRRKFFQILTVGATAFSVRLLGSNPPPATLHKNPIYVFPEKDLRGLSPNFHIHVSVNDLYIPGSVHIFSCSRIGDRGNIAHCRQIKVEIGTVATQFLFREYFLKIFGIVVCSAAAQTAFALKTVSSQLVLNLAFAPSCVLWETC